MEKLIECIRTVSNELGNHYKENIYQSALYVELNLKGYMVQTEVIVPIFYKNVYIGFERADIVIYNNDSIVIIELKSQNSRLPIRK
jgi:GxxExxY protein